MLRARKNIFALHNFWSAKVVKAKESINKRRRR
jgi:hypothetical protein